MDYTLFKLCIILLVWDGQVEAEKREKANSHQVQQYSFVMKK